MQIWKVWLVDDHAMILEGLKHSLDGKPDLGICRQFSNGLEVLECLENDDPPNLIILDINLPGMDGIELTGIIKKQYPQIKILILSMHTRNEFIRSIVNSGADGYIPKNAGQTILFTAIKKIKDGGKYFPPELLKDIFTINASLDSMKLASLTKREKLILQLIAEGKTSNSIAKELNVSIHTVNSHRKNLYAKVEAHNSVDLINFALRTGIIKGFDIF